MSFFPPAAAAKLQPLTAVNLVNASGSAPLSPSLALSVQVILPHAGAKETQAQMQLAVVRHFVAVKKFQFACRCFSFYFCFCFSFGFCCGCGCCGLSLEFVAKTVYWFAMCNSHSMKIELFVWLFIQPSRANSVLACKATA